MIFNSCDIEFGEFFVVLVLWCEDLNGLNHGGQNSFCFVCGSIYVVD
jgi:hypothetical protein